MYGILTFTQSGNGKTVTITDGSSWGGDNPSLTDITRIQIDIIYDSTTYSDVIDENSDDWAGDTPIQSELVWEITADNAGQSADTSFIDGIYYVVYKVTVGAGTFDDTTISFLLSRNIQYDIHDKFRQQPYKFDNNDIAYDETVEYNLLCYSFLKSLEYGANLGAIAKITDILDTLEDLVLES